VTTQAASDLLPWAKDVGLPILGFLAGFATSRWTLSKKDRKDLEQKNYENTEKLTEEHDAAYHAYTCAIGGFSDAASADLGLFFEVATKGDRYLLQLNRVATAILSGKVDEEARDRTLLPIIRSAASRTLPDHYATLRTVADKHGFTYNGELRRTDYGAIYDVVERYGPGPEWGGG
jgi:hypothetical protein